MSDVTRILAKIESGDPQAAEELLPLVYNDLRRLATQRLRQERPGQTLQATALVHEAYLRLVDVEKAQQWDSRGHFFSAAAQAMRRILVENARRKKSQRHGGDWQRIHLSGEDVPFPATPDQILELDDAMDRLAREEPEANELISLCVFAGLPVAQAGAILGMSRATAYRTWSYARAWLRAELTDRGDSGQISP